MTNTENSKSHRSMPAQRRLEISEVFVDQPAVRIDDLADRFGVSRETIRRDLITLENRGVLQRVHGGGIRQEVSPSEPPFEERLVQQSKQKTAIAKLTAGLVAEAETLFLDVGTSVARVVDFLPDSFRGEIITNSVLAAHMLAHRSDLQVILCGGRMRHGDMAVSGPSAAKMLRDVFVQVALLGSGGVDTQHGLTDFYPDEIDLRKIVIENSQTALVVADSSKVGKVATHRVTSLELLSGIVTDSEIENRHLEDMRNIGLTVHVAEVPDST